MSASDTCAHLSAKLQQPEANGLRRGIGELGKAQTDTAQRVDQHIGHRREPHAQLVGRHGGGGSAIGEQLELLTDTILGLATGAIQLLVEDAGIGEAGVLARAR